MDREERRPFTSKEANFIEPWILDTFPMQWIFWKQTTSRSYEVIITLIQSIFNFHLVHLVLKVCLNLFWCFSTSTYELTFDSRKKKFSMGRCGFAAVALSLVNVLIICFYRQLWNSNDVLRIKLWNLHQIFQDQFNHLYRMDTLFHLPEERHILFNIFLYFFYFFFYIFCLMILIKCLN